MPPPARPEATALLSPGDVQSHNSRQLASYNVQLRQASAPAGQLRRTQNETRP